MAGSGSGTTSTSRIEDRGTQTSGRRDAADDHRRAFSTFVAELAGELHAVLPAQLTNRPGGGRRRRVVSLVHIPGAEISR